ncbi:cytochrome P450 [Nonomuraea sp. NPDC048916]|uniref:cytochrome P450 n=1 Tax=Nonomuraea sp. NPDC048916 TaxID=3154232 RepID=UPI0033D26455
MAESESDHPRRAGSESACLLEVPAGPEREAGVNGPPRMPVDLTDPRTFAGDGMRPVWRALRDAAPVHWHPEGPDRPGFWVVVTHAEGTEVCSAPDRFTSCGGNVLATLLKGGDSASGRMAGVSDGPRHREIRHLLRTVLAPNALAPVLAGVRERTRSLLARAVAQGEFDFMADVADHVPIATVCELMGVPESDRPALLAWSKMALSSDTDETTEWDAMVARSEILAYFHTLARRRRSDGGDDLVSALGAATPPGGPLTAEEIAANCYSVLIGGDESSRMVAGGAVQGLIEHPAQWRALRAGTVSPDHAVEEVLRWTAPAMHLGRHAVSDTLLGGVRIQAGDIVTVWISSANFDERAFADPSAFDLARWPNRHLSLGRGPHFCVGAHLGRAALRILLTLLRDSAVRFEPTGPGNRVFSNFLSGYSSLPVRAVRSHT